MNNKYVNCVNLYKSVIPNMINIEIEDAHFILDYNVTNNHIFSINLFYSKIPTNDTGFSLIDVFYKVHNRKLLEKYMIQNKNGFNGVYIPIDVFKDKVSQYDKDILNCMKKYVSLF